MSGTRGQHDLFYSTLALQQLVRRIRKFICYVFRGDIWGVNLQPFHWTIVVSFCSVVLIICKYNIFSWSFYTLSFPASCNVEFRNFVGFVIRVIWLLANIEFDGLVLSRRPSSVIIAFNFFFKMFLRFQSKFDRKLDKRDQDFSSNDLNWEFPVLKLFSSW